MYSKVTTVVNSYKPPSNSFTDATEFWKVIMISFRIRSALGSPKEAYNNYYACKLDDYGSRETNDTTTHFTINNAKQYKYIMIIQFKLIQSPPHFDCVACVSFSQLCQVEVTSLEHLLSSGDADLIF